MMVAAAAALLLVWPLVQKAALAKAYFLHNHFLLLRP
jgi:hypothetical protein